MTDFDYEVVQKKRAARGAFARKCGSKSKRCKLSTDYMSRKQWEKKNGAIFTYNINKPMSWNEFKSMPVDLQCQYLKNLRLYYDVNMVMLRKMFGISQPTLRNHIDKYCSSVDFQRCHGRTPESVMARWDKFLACEDTVPENYMDENAESEVIFVDDSPNSCDIEDSILEQDTPEVAILNVEKPHNMAMHHFTLCFNGQIDPNMIANSIRNLVGANAIGRIDIHCDLEG